MHDTLPIEMLIVLSVVSCFSGIVDTLFGGGGLITVPALMATGLNPIAALGTNKLQAAVSELSATLKFSKLINYRSIWPFAVYTCIGSLLGAFLLQATPSRQLSKAVPWLLVFAFVCFLIPKRRALEQATKFSRLKYIAPIIGFYNGFFGPGTGSLWSVALMKVVNLDAKNSVFYAKPLNFIGNLASLVVFLFSGKIYMAAAVFMGCGSFLGGRIGAHLVIKNDARLIRYGILAIFVVSIISAFHRY